MSDSSSTSSETGASLQVSVIFNGRVQADIESSLARESSAAAGGVLVGTADPTLGVVVILAAEPLPKTTPPSRSLEFTPAVWANMISVVFERHPGQRIVGWYHGHLGSGVFMSGHDLLIHTMYFGQPWQVAYVVDPTKDERGVFAWRDQEIVRVEQWDTTSGARGVASSVAPNEPEGRTALLRHLAEPVNPRTRPVPAGLPDPVPEPPIPALAPTVDDSADTPPWGYPVEEQRQDVTAPGDPPAVAPEVEDDLDAWIASLPTGGDPGVPAGVTFDEPLPRATNHEEEVHASPGSASHGRSRRQLLIAVIAGLIIAALILVVVLASRSDDKGTASTTTAAPVAISTVTIAVTTTTAKATTTVAPSTTDPAEQTVATNPPTSATSAPTTAAPTTTIAAALPPTPDAVASPAARVGSGSTPCPLGSDGLYAPVANCFVPLPNGNILADFNGILVCTDPPGAILGDAAPFLVGFGGDPLSVIANGVVLPRCEDLAYTKNVMAAGASTFPGLCGNANTSIDQGSTRCFAQNPSTGAIAALVAALGTDNGLAGMCFAAAGQPLPMPLTWTTPGVDASWRIVSVGFEPGIQQFVVTANRDGELATTVLACE